uniref:PH domain-containing protein n=1 Tax=Schistocephalus solidus TaxID=70667 RepID=A0A0V0J2I4_SCHSO
MELLRLPEAMSNAPYSQQLACQFAGEADKINKHLQAFSSACTRVCMAQDALSEAYIQLSEVARMISSQDSMVQAKNSDVEQTGLQFSSFLEELSVLHQRFSDELRSSMFMPPHKLPSQPNLQLTGPNPETLIRFTSTSDTQKNYDSCEHEMEVALKNYMKLSKRCTPKQHDDTVQELSRCRWLFKKAAVIYHARLNAAHFERDLVPLTAFHGFLTSLRLHTERVSQMTTLQSMTDFCETIKIQQDCRQVQATEATADFLNTLSRIESYPLEFFAPEPLLAKTDTTYLRSPNTKLLKKSGYLYLRTRKAFITDWIEVFCFTQGGNLLCQSKSELAASVLVNLNGKGVFTEPVDCDDRRYTFHVVSATEKRTVILQAENSTERDEWIATLSNVIIATNGWSARELTEAAAAEDCPSNHPHQMIANSQLSVDEEANLQTALRLSMSCQVWISQSPPPPVLNILSAMSANRQDTVSESNFDATFPLTFVGALQLAEHLNDPNSLTEASNYIIAQSATQAPRSCIARLTSTAVWLFDGPTGDETGLQQQQLAYFPLAQIASCLTPSKDGRHVVFLISPPHSETDNGLPPGDLPWCLTFESDSPTEISECVLAAQLNRVTSLTAASDLAEKSKLVAIISRSSNFGDVPCSDSPPVRTSERAAQCDPNLGKFSPRTHIAPKPTETAVSGFAALGACFSNLFSFFHCRFVVRFFVLFRPLPFNSYRCFNVFFSPLDSTCQPASFVCESRIPCLLSASCASTSECFQPQRQTVASLQERTV